MDGKEAGVLDVMQTEEVGDAAGEDRGDGEEEIDPPDRVQGNAAHAVGEQTGEHSLQELRAHTGNITQAGKECDIINNCIIEVSVCELPVEEIG